MAHASRFPQLALPFAIVGAAAGWLSTGLLAHPLVGVTRPGKQGLAAVCAMLFAGACGALITRWCVGRAYSYELCTPDPEARVRTDTWQRHVLAVLVAGSLSGAVVALVCGAYGGAGSGATSGLVCAIAFVPVCLAVIAAARRAKRARLGSIVAGSDRRAVWSMLAITLSVATLEALPDWPAARRGEVATPTSVLWMLLAVGAAIAAILVADVLAFRRARRATAEGLEAQAQGAVDPGDAAIPRIDLGLGDDRLARIARSASAYRGRDRALSLVQGSPEQARGALRRAIARSALGFVVVLVVGGVHAAANTEVARVIYDDHRTAVFHERACREGIVESCRLAHLARSCALGDPLSCAAVRVESRKH